MKSRPRASTIDAPPLSVASAAWQRVPGLRLVLLVARGLDNHKARPVLVEALAERQAILRATWSYAAPLDHPHLSCWHDVLPTLDGQPDRPGSSVERLVHRALSDRPAGSTNPMVDLLEVLSLRFLVPIMAWDLDQLAAEPTLGFTTGAERFVGRGTAGWEPVAAGELAFLSTPDVIARPFVGRLAKHGKITASTHRTLAVAAVPRGRAPNLASRIGEALTSLVAVHFGIAARTWILRE